MPVERISQAFKDISASFLTNPINNDLIDNKNETAIARSIRNLVYTIPGEKPFQPLVGSNVSNLLFESLDRLTSSSIRDEIEYTITSYEPRVRLTKVDVLANEIEHSFDVTIRYNIVGIDVPQQTLTFALESTR
jgi:phage baseplate assembly protein W|tara:strand:- start:392 stop:793 length:402 start_codon:yes stop_codon:yes gene_type:complete